MFSSAPLFFDACISKRIPVKGGFLGCLGEKKENSVFLLIALRGQNILFLHRQNRNINAKGEFFMAEIQVTNLTFEYEGSFEPVLKRYLSPLIPTGNSVLLGGMERERRHF